MKCLICGKEFTQIRKWQTCCSERCRIAKHRGQNKLFYDKICMICGKKFKTTYSRKSVCSFICRVERSRLFSLQRSREIKKDFFDNGKLNEREIKYKIEAEKQGWKLFHRGFPDFLMYNEKTNKIKFVEVKQKSKGKFIDNLTSDQKKVIEVLQKSGNDAEVIYLD